jgi:hypothetical protein
MTRRAPDGAPAPQWKVRGVHFATVGTRLGDLAILNRGRAGDADGPDNLAVSDERTAALQRRGSA